VALLKFSKGDWLIGQDNAEVPPGTKFIVNIPELLRAGCAGKTRNPPTTSWAESMIVSRLPLRSELSDQDKEYWELDASGKPRDPCKNLLHAFERHRTNSEELTPSPHRQRRIVRCWISAMPTPGKTQAGRRGIAVIALGGGSYPHPNRQLGIIKTPKFMLVAWGAVNRVR